MFVLLMHECPWPINSGPKMHTHGLARILCSMDRAVVLAFYKDEEELEAYKRMAQQELYNCEIIPIKKKKSSFIKRLSYILRLRLISQSYYDDTEIPNIVKQHKLDDKSNTVFFQSIHAIHSIKYFEKAFSVLIPHDAFSLNHYRAFMNTRHFTVFVESMVRWILFYKLETCLYKKFSAVCVVSKIDCAYLRSKKRGLNCLQTVHIPLFKTVNSSVRKLEHPNKAVIFLAGSFFIKTYGEYAVEFLKKVWPVLKERFPGITLNMCGPRPVRQIYKIIASDESIKHHGWVDDYAAFICKSHIFVYPQKGGSGMQTKILHALSLGLPVVGFPETLDPFNIENQHNGMIVESFAGLGDAIQYLLNNESRRMEIALNGKKLVEDICSVVAVTEQIKSVLAVIKKQDVQKLV